MSNLIVEFALRLAKVLLAVIFGYVVYWIATGPLAAPGSPELAVLSFIAGVVTLLLMEESPL